MTNRPEVWQNVHAALQILWESDLARLVVNEISVDEETETDEADVRDPTIALATAQSILDAGDITLPTGNLADGVYDALGNYYQLPCHIVSDPVNLIPDEQVDSGEVKYTQPPEAEDDEEAEARRREEKGKAVVDVRSQINATVRLSDTSRDLTLRVGKDETVRNIIRRIAEETGVSPLRSRHRALSSR